MVSYGVIHTSYADSTPSTVIGKNFINFTIPIGNKTMVISMPNEKLLFKPVANVKTNDNGQKIVSVSFIQKSDLLSLYHDLGWYKMQQKAVFVYPIFTQAAYGKHGFYDYYAKTCDSKCLTVPIPTTISSSYVSSAKGAAVLTLLYYPFITDLDIDKNPDILKKYDKVILLHNEYVTKKEFDAITNHPNVVYLYPNSLYALVNVNYFNNVITLVKGHGYQNTLNAFGWKYDNSKLEYDFDCSNWKFDKTSNGKQLNCYPEYRLLSDKDLLKAIKN